jgi:hypothetical protein|tara:strand:- start:948 stop:1535 length:588 start_codon:yes stop_codon:yes gene_type:complete
MKNLLLLSIYLTSFFGFTQDQDYFVINNKKTFCTDLEYSITAQSYLRSISYTDTNGKKIEIKGRKNVPDITSFYIDNIIVDRVPQKTNKPDKYVKWARRIIDGKLIVNFYSSSMTTHNFNSAAKPGRHNSVTTGIVKHYVKMPNGTYYDIFSSKDRKKHIIPYLKKCKEFNSTYDGKFKIQEFNEIIVLYNQLCE